MSTAVSHATFAQLIARALTGNTAQTALTDEHGRSYSYGEASDTVMRMGTSIIDERSAQGKGIGILAYNRPDAWMAMQGSILRGGFVGALPYRSSLEDLIQMSADAQLDALIVDPAHAEMGQRMKEAGVVSEVLVLGDAEVGPNLLARAASAPSRRLAAANNDGDSLSRLVYTGGSTGRPKAITYTQRAEAEAALRLLWVAEMPVDIRYLLMAPMTHGGWMSMLPALLKNGSIHFIEQFDAEVLPEMIERHAITYIAGVPNHLYGLLDAMKTASADVSSLKRLLYGGSAIAPDRLADALEVFGPVMTGMYGMQEAGGGISVLWGSDHRTDRPDILSTSGRFLPGVIPRLVTHEGQDVEPGQVGEIIIKSPTVCAGYWNQPEQTAELLMDGWLRTGDLGRVDDEGYLTIVGRSKDMVVTGGFNIFPIEVENVLAGHPDVGGVAVFGVPHEKWGEAVHAVVQLRPGAAADAESLIALVKDRKGSIYAPKSIEFRDSLPVTSAGKVDKTLLRAAFWPSTN
ncbi:AMP-binding protein [Microbacterium sp. A93]|uniref:AMP-binding protein n=1 Tax=Microbacterium sp. A93 TaxID=3450716 RepID=UPI003F435459